MKKIFITGGNGYLGSELTLQLSKKNYQVVSLINKKKIKRLKNVKYVFGNLSSNLEKYLTDLDLIIHCAASGVYNKRIKKKMYKTNNEDSINFLKRAYKAGCKNWILMGSSTEYGYLKNKPISVKTTRLKPIDSYGLSKLKFFKNLLKFRHFNNCKILYLRIFQLYGKNEPRGRLYRDLIDSINNNVDFKMTDGNEIRDFIHINEAIRKIIKSFKLFDKKNFFLVKHLAEGKGIMIKDFVKNIWKKNKAKNKILIGSLRRKAIYHSMYSDKSSLI